MKEIFLNSAKCAYISVRQSDLLSTSGIICFDFLEQYFYSGEYSVLDYSIANILRCLNLKKCTKFYRSNVFSDYDFEDVYGRIYNAGDIYKVFAVKHTEKWYEDVWDCIREGKDGAYKLIEEALENVEKYDEKLKIRKEIFFFD